MKQQGIYLREINAADKDAVIDIVGVIGWEVWYPALREMLASIPDTVERIIFDIYSPGGDVWEGNAIIQTIGAMKQETIARIQVAASMATLIAVACDKREIASNGRWLIHNPWTALAGDAASLEKRAKELRDCEIEAAQFYANRTGQTVETMIDLMAEERWLTPAETMELGFVQSVNDPFDRAAFAEVRAEIVAAGKWPQTLIKEMEGPDDDATTPGAEGVGSMPTPEPEQPAMLEGAAEQPPRFKDLDAAWREGFEKGKAETDASLHEMYNAALDATVSLSEELTKVQAEVADRTAEARKLQSERDKARADGEQLRGRLDETTTQITRLLAGGMTFVPEVQTWAEAMRKCDGNYERARKEYPEVYRAQRELDKQHRE